MLRDMYVDHYLIKCTDSVSMIDGLSRWIVVIDKRVNEALMYQTHMHIVLMARIG